MKQLIADLKERPKEDRAAFAGLIAGTIAVVIFFVWATFFIRGIQDDARVRAARNAATGEGYENPAAMVKNATEDFSDRYDDTVTQYAEFNAQVAAVGQLAPSEDVTVGAVTVLATSTPVPKSDFADDSSADNSGF